MSRAVRGVDVCVVGLRGIPEVMGGVEAHCEELYSRLARQDEDHRFVVLARAPYVAHRSQVRSNLSVIPVWSPRGRYFEAIAHTTYAVLYSRFRLGARIIHIHAIGPGLVTPLAKALGMKVILTHHGEDYRRQKWNGLAKAVLRVGEWLGVRCADRVIVVSRSVAEGLKARFPRRADDIYFVPNGANVADAGNDGGAGPVLARYGLEAGRFVLAVGRLVPEKGFHDLVTAFEASGSTDRLVVAGGVEHESDYSRALLKRAGRNVVFTGRLSRAELGELYANASLFVLPSYHEGLPIAALEALGSGAPVLLSDIQPNRDVALPKTNYFRTGDTADLARALNRPADSYRVGADVLRKYDWDRIADNTRSILDSLDDTAPQPAPRILFAVNSLEGGGAERVMARLVAGLRRAMPSADITLALLDDRPEKHPIPDGVRIVRLDCDGSTPKSVRRLRSLARQTRPDVIVSFLTRSNIAAVIAARSAGARCIVSERVHTSSHFGSGARAAVNKLAVRALYPRADAIVAVSDGVARDLAENYRVAAGRLVTINNPVDTAAIREAAGGRPALDLPERFVLAAGRLVPNKNFAMLIRAYARSGIAADLVILGEGPERARLEAMVASLGLAARVHLPGYVDDPHPVMARAACYVSASNAEGFPNAMVEAMVLGVPVVATDCRSGPAEILGGGPEGHVEGVSRADHGILVPPGSEADMTRALQTMLGPDVREHYRARSLERAGAFEAQSIIGRYARLIDAVRRPA